MAKKLSGKTTMDDVDRLFQCFKCGISPPGQLSFFPSLSLSVEIANCQLNLMSSFSASAMRERKRRKKMLNPDNNTSPETCKSLQTSSLSGKRNQIDASPSLESLVCIINPTCCLYFIGLLCVFMIVFLCHIPVWFQ